jgi:hypothetical protein
MLDRLKVFAELGRIENERLRSEYLYQLTDNLPAHDYLSIIFAISITWTHHAHNNNGFLDYAIPFMESSNPVDQNQVRLHMHQHGEDALAVTLTNMRALRNFLKTSHRTPDFRTCSAEDLWKFQSKTEKLINTGIAKGTLTGIGPWLTYGPAKIILCFENRLWNDPDAEPIILSTGMEVVRGVKILVDKSFIDPSILPYMKDGDAQSAIIIHREFEKLALKVGSMAMHMNTAAHMLGRGDISI